MFDSLSDKLQDLFSALGRKGKLTESDVELALREVQRALLAADVNFKVVKEFVARIRQRAVGVEVLESFTPAQQVVKIVTEELIQTLGSSQEKLKTSSDPPTVVMLVGLQGSGKTTTAAKLALHLRKQGQRPMMVAADPYRPAAVLQLQTLGKQLDMPVFHDPTRKPPELARAAVEDARKNGFNFVLLDTAGRLHIAEDMMRELDEVKKRVSPHEILLIADAMTGQDAVKVAEAFHARLGLTGAILTKMDGDAQGGAALSLRAVTGVPIKFVGAGEKPDALEPFYPDRVAQRILGMGDVLSLIERANEVVDRDKQKELEKKLRTGTFDLQAFLDSMRQVQKMGPLDQLLEKIPGVGRMMKAQNAPRIEEKQLKRVEAIILSMTPEERRQPTIIGGSRKRRIARGSGTTAADINQLLNQFREMQKMLRGFSGGGPGVPWLPPGLGQPRRRR
jgi:signal recognition particle subunit SRP54